jgi:hypothetical protein
MNLIDQIDKPLYKSVGLLNLLGAKTIWTCCGYDYPEQAESKGHLYGTLQIHMECTERAMKLGQYLIRTVPGLNLRYIPSMAGSTNILQCYVNYKDIGLPECWTDYKNNPHAHEMGSMIISNIERSLLGVPKEEFQETVTLNDSNEQAKKIFPLWAHPIAEPWVIERKVLLGA